MIKKYLLIIVALLIQGCIFNSHSVDPLLNPADRHIWLPPDEEDFEKRRLNQSYLDSITKDIENIFLNLEVTLPIENDIRSGARDLFSDIDSLEEKTNVQIDLEGSRVGKLNNDVDSMQINSKKINSEMVKLYLAPVFTAQEYRDAYSNFKQGKYKRSSGLFKNLLRLDPPHSLIDNILFGLSMSYIREKQYSLSKVHLSRLIKEHPGSDKWHMSHVMLALAHEMIGEKSQALYILNQGLKNNPPYFVQSVFKNMINIIHGESINFTN